MKVLTILLIIFLCGSGVRSDCYDVTDCKLCVDKSSWFLDTSCRWCPFDRACHAFGAFDKNPCSSDQNIKRADACYKPSTSKPFNKDQVYSSSQPSTSKPYGIYNKEESYRQLLFSAVAYSKIPEQCLPRVPGLDRYTIINVIIRGCSKTFSDYIRCMAYVAVSKRNKEIIVAFSGTKKTIQLLQQGFSILLKNKTTSPIGGEVEKYFKDASDNLYPCLKNTLRNVVVQNPAYNVKITGHSLGGAIASITSARLVKDKIVQKEKMTLYTFGMPRVGNRNYADRHDELVNNSFRVVHARDIVAHLPSCKFISCKDKPYHHGTEIFYPIKYMTVNSYYETCYVNEDKSCSNGAIKQNWCLTDMLKCIEDHKLYFDINVGNYCKKTLKSRRFKRSANDISFDDPGIASKDHCTVYHYDGNSWTSTEFVGPNALPVPTSTESSKNTSSRGAYFAKHKGLLVLKSFLVVIRFALA